MIPISTTQHSHHQGIAPFVGELDPTAVYCKVSCQLLMHALSGGYLEFAVIYMAPQYTHDELFPKNFRIISHTSSSYGPIVIKVEKPDHTVREVSLGDDFKEAHYQGPTGMMLQSDMDWAVL